MPENGKTITVSNELHLELKRAALDAGKKLGEFVESILKSAVRKPKK